MLLYLQIISAVYLHESEAVPKPLGLIKGKIAVAKAKLAIAKAPHLIASAIVAKEVKAKTKIAFAKAVAAVSDAFWLTSPSSQYRFISFINLFAIFFIIAGQSGESSCKEYHFGSIQKGQDKDCRFIGWFEIVEST